MLELRRTIEAIKIELSKVGLELNPMKSMILTNIDNFNYIEKISIGKVRVNFRGINRTKELPVNTNSGI